MLKIDEKHPKFRGKVLCSAGIGSGYLKREDAKRHTYIPGKTNESYRMRNGGKLNLPIYYRNKIFTEQEREKLFLDKIEKGIVYVLGQKLDMKNDQQHYLAVLIQERERCERLYHDNPKDWNERPINIPIYRGFVEGKRDVPWSKDEEVGESLSERYGPLSKIIERSDPDRVDMKEIGRFEDKTGTPLEIANTIKSFIDG